MPLLDAEILARANAFHSWDAMSPAALEAIVRRGAFASSVETGCGGSTIILSHISEEHKAFALEGTDRTITELQAHPDLRGDRTQFIEGETKRTLPAHRFDSPLDFVLLDGPHAYPLPQVEFVYLFPHLKAGGWMALDDLQIPAVHELYRFLLKEPFVALEEVVLRTAFFRKLQEMSDGPDDWQSQAMNRQSILRFAWRDKLRRLAGRP